MCAYIYCTVLHNTITHHLGYLLQSISQAIIRPIISRALRKSIQKPYKFMWDFARLLTLYRSDDGLVNGPKSVTWTCNCVVKDCVLNIMNEVHKGCVA